MPVIQALCLFIQISRINNMLKKAFPIHQGFTLIELMVTLVVASILLGVMAPSFVDLIKNSRLTAQINELSAALNLSRSEAIKRGAVVTICSSNDQSSCSGSWQDGWIVFEDTDGNDSVNGNDTLILVHGSLSESTTLNYTGGNKIEHEASGFSNSGYAGTFRLCDDRGQSFVKGLVINFSGRIRAASTDSGLTGCS
jgi:type IV fimbrial biogenesis protein FimT